MSNIPGYFKINNEKDEIKYLMRNNDKYIPHNDTGKTKKDKDIYVYIGYYIDGQPLCIHSSKRKVKKYLSITRDLDEDSYFIQKVLNKPYYEYDRLYLNTEEYGMVYTNLDILIIDDMFNDMMDDLYASYYTLKDSSEIFWVMDTSYIHKTIDRLKMIVDILDRKKEDKDGILTEMRYDYFNHNEIYKKDIYNYLRLRNSVYYYDYIWNKFIEKGY